MSLEYLFSPTKQFTYPSGKLLDGGKVYVYFKDTTDLATLYSPEGSFVSNPILLDANGRASVRADIEYQYRLEIYTNKDVLLYTCEAFCEGDGSGGFSFVIHDGTLSGNGTASNPLGVINIPLAVEDTLTAYEDIVEGKNSLVLGVNSAWLEEKFDQELAGKVDRTEFEDCCSDVNEALDNKLDSSAFDLSNYYNKQETNNLLDQRVDRYEFAQTMNWVDQTKQDKLEFGYDENSAISSINNSALAGGQGVDTTPWISGAKILADTQNLTDNMIIQVLSSFTLSGYKNHCIAVKGGTYRFPNAYELGDRIATTNYFMANSAMSGYLPTSSFTSYTASIASNLENNWNYTNSAYSLSINNFYNKLDASAFSAYTADAGETYTLVGGDNISISSDDEEKTTTISFTGEVGDTTPWISGAKILAETKYMEPGEYIQVLSSFTLSGNKNHCIAVKGGGYYFPTNYMLASGISSSLTGVFVPSSTFSSFVSSWSDHLSTLYGNDSYLSSCVSNISANKLDASSYHELTAGTNIDIQNYVISSKDWTNEIKEASANAFNEATAQIPEPFDPTYISAQIDNKLNKSESANYYPMTGNPSGFLTQHQDLSDYATTSQLAGKLDSSAINYKPFPGLGSLISGINGNKIWAYTAENASWADKAGTAVKDNLGRYITATYLTTADMTGYVPMSAVSALIDIVQTYSGKWLLNGDL